jgi:hypothetical protein
MIWMYYSFFKRVADKFVIRKISGARSPPVSLWNSRFRQERYESQTRLYTDNRPVYIRKESLSIISFLTRILRDVSLFRLHQHLFWSFDPYRAFSSFLDLGSWTPILVSHRERTLCIVRVHLNPLWIRLRFVEASVEIVGKKETHLILSRNSKASCEPGGTRFLLSFTLCISLCRIFRYVFEQKYDDKGKSS